MPHGPRFEKLVNDARSRVQEISPVDALEHQSTGAVLIDVREAEEFSKEHAKGALHLSKGVLELKIEQHVPNTITAVICYCGGGSRSLLASDNLKRMGYSNVHSMTGGFKL